MKQAILILAAVVSLAMAGCSKGDGQEVSYSERQLKAFAIFNGVWADTQFDVGMGVDKITFVRHYDSPVDFYTEDYMNGKTLNFTAHGELAYYESFNKESIECYYSVSKDADKINLYRKNEEKLYEWYNLSIKSETTMNWHDTSLSWPYVFVKQ